MAGTGTRYGQIEESPFDGLNRTREISENDRMTFEGYGDFDQLLALSSIRPGESVPSFFNADGNYKVVTCSLSREECNSGKITIVAVKTASKNSPYHYSVTIEFQSVEKDLITHPKLQDAKIMQEIKAWTDTPEAQRVKYDNNGAPTFIYYKVNANGIADNTPHEVKTVGGNKYCKAMIAGVTQYQQYLPVVTVVSSYLTIPGANIDETTHEVTGAISPHDSDKIGRLDTPPVYPSGFGEYLWFKNADRWTQNGDGTWQREEQWTCSNDKRFSWIYADGDSIKVIEEE